MPCRPFSSRIAIRLILPDLIPAYLSVFMKANWKPRASRFGSEGYGGCQQSEDGA